MRTMSLLLLGAGILDSICGGSHDDRADLIGDVRDIFVQVRGVVAAEGNATDVAVVDDIDRMMRRAQQRLKLIEELALLKITYPNNKLGTCDAPPKISRLSEETIHYLEKCTEKALQDITTSTTNLVNATESALIKGESLLDIFNACGEKSSLQVIPCYKNVMIKDVRPVKSVLLEAIEAHRQAHSRTIQIRNEGSDCIDSVMENYEKRIARTLSVALNCK